jgi:hypothetical protein
MRGDGLRGNRSSEWKYGKVPGGNNGEALGLSKRARYAVNFFYLLLMEIIRTQENKKNSPVK